MGGAIVAGRAFDLAEVEAAVGSATFDRGRTYAHRGRVLKVGWEPEGQALNGSVVGNGGLYRTTAYFVEAGGLLVFEDGECSCPVGYDCKHVAAIAIVAAGEAHGDDGPRRQRPSRQSAAASATPSWEAALRTLIGAPSEPIVGVPLAIELTLQPGGGPDRGGLRLLARLMRQGTRGTWVNGSLSWGGLDSWQLQRGGFRADHLGLVRELYAAHRADERRASYYGYGAEKTIDLAGLGPQLWPLLDEAERAGVVLLRARGRAVEEVPRPLAGEVVIDVTRPAADQEIRARLRVDGDDTTDLTPLLFLGSGGHGVVCSDGGVDDGCLRLVRLTRPVPPPLRRMVLEGGSLRIPAGDVDRFRQDLCPALQRVAPLESSDGSFARQRSPGLPSSCGPAMATSTSSSSDGSGRTRSAT